MAVGRPVGGLVPPLARRFGACPAAVVLSRGWCVVHQPLDWLGAAAAVGGGGGSGLGRCFSGSHRGRFRAAGAAGAGRPCRS